MIKKNKTIATIVFGAIICCMLLGTIVSSAAARNASVKMGTYCSVVGTYSQAGAGNISARVTGKNMTSSSKYMVVYIQAYKQDGSLDKQNKVALNTAAGAERLRTMDDIPSSDNVYGQTIIYRGTSVSTGILESVRIIIN